MKITSAHHGHCFYQSFIQVCQIEPFSAIYSLFRPSMFVNTGPFDGILLGYSNRNDHNVTLREFSEKSIL